jgi:hypothetical protein
MYPGASADTASERPADVTDFNAFPEVAVRDQVASVQAATTTARAAVARRETSGLGRGLGDGGSTVVDVGVVTRVAGRTLGPANGWGIARFCSARGTASVLEGSARKPCASIGAARARHAQRCPGGERRALLCRSRGIVQARSLPNEVNRGVNVSKEGNIATNQPQRMPWSRSICAAHWYAHTEDGLIAAKGGVHLTAPSSHPPPPRSEC